MSSELILPFLRPIEPLLLDDSVSENEANSTSRQDVYTRITSQIVTSLEQGVRPWVKPWNANMPPDASRSRCVSTSSPIPVLTSSRSG